MNAQKEAIAVERTRFSETETFQIEAEDRPLFDLLTDILDDVNVPEFMPAHLATVCEDLVDVRETVVDIDRGIVHLEGMARYGMSYCFKVRDAIDEYRDDPVTLATVGCSASKDGADEPLPARERYSSAYWTCKDRYGDVVADDYRIISAKHGLLDPERPIADYERTPEDLRGVPVQSEQRLPNGDDVATLLDQWALDVYEELVAWIKEVAGDDVDPKDVRLEILLGRRYREVLEERGVFDRLSAPAGLEITFPFQEVEQAQGGNGNQMNWMTDQIDAVQGAADD